MARLVLVCESLREGVLAPSPDVRFGKVRRVRARSATPEQPSWWSMLDLTVADDDLPAFAQQLADRLLPGPWYVDAHTATATYVIFSGRVWSYPAGDAAGRAEAQRYARGVGVPEGQLDWPETPDT